MPLPAAPEPRDAARKAALERLKAAGKELSPALVGEAETSLSGAFALCDLLRRIG